MTFCAKCHQNEATIHFTAVVTGAQEETVDLCKDCAPPGFQNLDLAKLEALSVIGKKCEFCGKDAFSGEMGAEGSAIYWCHDCGLEISRIFADLCASERPDLMQRSKEERTFLSMCFDPELQTWFAVASQKAVQILKERKRQDGRDTGNL
jgi:protein-arginine kinase activator protein McsA